MNPLPLYSSHSGTVRVSGTTVPKRCANCAHFYLLRGVSDIDFFCIGANANQQAMKAMGMFMLRAEKEDPLLVVSFKPLRFQTNATNPKTGAQEVIDCTVWRTVLHRHTSSAR